MKKMQKGFTLIELLIVVAIIGILSALLTTNFIGIRQRARDAQRKSDLRQIQSSLELYRSDQGSYPISGTNTAISAGNCPTPGSFTGGSSSTYLKKIPCDPLGATYYNAGNYYYFSSDGSTYTLASCLENSSDTDQNDNTTSPGGTNCPVGSKYFILYNP